MRRQGRANGAKQTQSRRDRSGAGSQLRKTKPIPGGRGIPPFHYFHYSIVPAFQSDAGRAKQSQFPAGTMPQPFHDSIIPVFQSAAFRAKQSQFSSRRSEGQMSSGKGVMMNSGSPRLRQNKANSSSADSGFRIADWGLPCGSTPALQPATSDARGPIVRNKPNSAGAIRRASALRRRSSVGSNLCTAGAKQSQFGQGSGFRGQRSDTRSLVPGLLCGTKPIAPEGWEEQVPSGKGVAPNLTCHHGRDAGDTHGRDAHATIRPGGVTTNVAVFPRAKSPWLRYIGPVRRPIFHR